MISRLKADEKLNHDRKWQSKRKERRTVHLLGEVVENANDWYEELRLVGLDESG